MSSPASVRSSGQAQLPEPEGSTAPAPDVSASEAVLRSTVDHGYLTLTRSFSSSAALQEGELLQLPLHLLPSPVFPQERVPLRLTNYSARHRDRLRQILRTQASSAFVGGIFATRGGRRERPSARTNFHAALGGLDTQGSIDLARVGCVLEIERAGGVEEQAGGPAGANALDSDDAGDLMLVARAVHLFRMETLQTHVLSGGEAPMALVRVLSNEGPESLPPSLLAYSALPAFVWQQFAPERLCDRIYSAAKATGIITEALAQRAEQSIASAQHESGASSTGVAEAFPLGPACTSPLHPKADPDADTSEGGEGFVSAASLPFDITAEDSSHAAQSSMLPLPFPATAANPLPLRAAAPAPPLAGRRPALLSDSTSGSTSASTPSAVVPPLTSTHSARLRLREPWQFFGYGPTEFSFWVARNLPCSAGFKQHLLETKGTINRLRAILTWLSDRISQAKSEQQEAEQRARTMMTFRCRGCGNPVTDQAAITAMSESGVSAFFTNPHGMSFRILTATKVFLSARPTATEGSAGRCYGVRMQGTPESKDSWYSAFAWTIMLCGGCGTHLGWRFDFCGLPGAAAASTNGGAASAASAASPQWAKLPPRLAWSRERQNWIQRPAAASASSSAPSMEGLLSVIRGERGSLEQILQQILRGTVGGARGTRMEEEDDDSEEDIDSSDDEQDGELDDLAAEDSSEPSSLTPRGAPASTSTATADEDAKEPEEEAAAGPSPARGSSVAPPPLPSHTTSTRAGGGGAATPIDARLTTSADRGVQSRSQRPASARHPGRDDTPGSTSMFRDLLESLGRVLGGDTESAPTGDGGSGLGSASSAASSSAATPSAGVATLSELVGPPPAGLPAVFYGLRHEALVTEPLRASSSGSSSSGHIVDGEEEEEEQEDENDDFDSYSSEDSDDNDAADDDDDDDQDEMFNDAEEEGEGEAQDDDSSEPAGS